MLWSCCEVSWDCLTEKIEICHLHPVGHVMRFHKTRQIWNRYLYSQPVGDVMSLLSKIRDVAHFLFIMGLDINYVMLLPDNKGSLLAIHHGIRQLDRRTSMGTHNLLAIFDKIVGKGSVQCPLSVVHGVRMLGRQNGTASHSLSIDHRMRCAETA